MTDRYAGIEPHLWVSDLERVRGFYVDVLGFSVRSRFPDDGPATWCSLERGGARIMLATAPPPERAVGTQAYAAEAAGRIGKPGPCSLYVPADDVDAVHDAVLASPGGAVVEPLWDTWWGLRQFTLTDPDGNWLTFHRPRD